MKASVAVACAVACLLMVAGTPAQEREDRTLLPWDEMRSIINETSGDRAMHHVLELVPYPRVRPLTEYTGNFRESEVMARFAREYGYSDVRIESFPTANRLWQPTVGELWMVEPELKKIYDIQDVAVSLAANSAPGDVTAELVDIGPGAEAAMEGKDLEGKIVLSSPGVAPLARALPRGAAGILGVAALRPDDYPNQILSSSTSTRATSAGRQRRQLGLCADARDGPRLPAQDRPRNPGLSRRRVRPAAPRHPDGGAEGQGIGRSPQVGGPACR
jgi:hypothetical protein